MFQNLWMQKTPRGFLRRLRSMLRHLAAVNGPLGYNLVAGFSDGLWMVASSDFWISKSSDDPKVSNEWSIMVYVKSIYFLPDFFFRSSLFGPSSSPSLRPSGTTTASASFLLKLREGGRGYCESQPAFAWQKCQHICESICPEMRWGSLEVK